MVGKQDYINKLQTPGDEEVGWQKDFWITVCTLTATFCDGYSCCTTAALTDLTDSGTKSLTDDEMAGCKGFPFSGAGTLNGVDAQLQHDGPDNWIGYAEITLDGGSVVSVGSSTASVTAGDGDNVLAPVAHVSLVV